MMTEDGDVVGVQNQKGITFHYDYEPVDYQLCNEEFIFRSVFIKFVKVLLLCDDCSNTN